MALPPDSLSTLSDYERVLKATIAEQSPDDAPSEARPASTSRESGNGQIPVITTQEASGVEKGSTPAAGEAEEGKEEKQWITEIKRLIQFIDLQGNTHVVPAEGYRRRKIRKDVDGPYKDYAMLLRQSRSVRGSLISYRLEIQSEGLRDIFQNIATPYKEIDVTATPILVEAPFTPLFFLRGQLKELSQSSSIKKSVRKELEELVSFVESDDGLRTITTEYDALVQKGKMSRKLQWTLFKPREIIYQADKAYAFEGEEFVSDSCCVVDSIESVDDNATGAMQWKLHYVFLRHDGSDFRLVRRSRTLRSGNPKEVLDISTENFDYVPLSLLGESRQKEIRQKLVERGKRYVELRTKIFSFLRYRGPLSITSEQSNKRLFGVLGKGVQVQQQVHADTRCIIDMTAQGQFGDWDEGLGAGGAQIVSRNFREYSSVSTGTKKTNLDAQFGRLLDAKMSKTAPTHEEASWLPKVDEEPSASDEHDSTALQDADYLLCPAIVSGFFLEDKVWAGSLLITCLQPIEWKSDPFNRLQLPVAKKSLIRSLVDGFGKEGSSLPFEDVVAGKGRGLVFLLHGPPGLGKTLTAESVAESTQRPLYHVSTGELSADVSVLEKQLSEVFNLGLRWGAVVLLDEADVLMTKRNINDLQRNAIVAVFLRMLEYYHGMLILTTNRFADFDEAFYNRMNLTIRFEDLDEVSRTNIWRQHLTRATSRNKRGPLWTEEAFALLGKMQTNGRDIRNYSRTAFGHAMSGGGDFAIEHLLAVVRNNLVDAKAEEAEPLLEELEKLGQRLDQESRDLPSTKEPRPSETGKEETGNAATEGD